MDRKQAMPASKVQCIPTEENVRTAAKCDSPAKGRRSRDSKIAALERRLVGPRQYIFRENETGDLAFIILKGEVEIVKHSKKSDKILATIGEGGIFGEMALIENKPRMASARAANGGPVELLVISRDIFCKKLAYLDPFTKGLMRILSEYARSNPEAD